MRDRLTKQAMGKNDSPTTMDVEVENPKADKYETGTPESFGEGVNMDKPWEQENSAGREETGHPKMKTKANTYASMVREAKELEAKALRCLKMAETILPDASVDVIEKQAVDFMTMSSNSVNSTLRRMREFDEVISEARVAKIVDAVMEVMAEEKEEVKEEEEVKEAAKEEEKEEEEVKEAAKEEEKEDEDAKIATIVEAVLEVMAEEEKEEEKEEEVKEAAEEEEEKEEEKEAKKASDEISFDELGDVMASQEDEQLLSQIFTAEEAPKEVKEAKIKTLKNVTASKGVNEIDKLSSLWRKDY